jgi:hypothetical protein
MKAAVLLLSALLVSCGSGRTAKQVQADNQIALDNPDVVGRLPDGRTLYHSSVKIEGVDRFQEIFYAGRDITINSSTGKANTVRAIISEPKEQQ